MSPENLWIDLEGAVPQDGPKSQRAGSVLEEKLPKMAPIRTEKCPNAPEDC